MANAFQELNFLYLHDSAIDMHLKRLREVVKSIPQNVLQLEHNCFPIIIDYSESRLASNRGIVLGHGFHHSDFDVFAHPREGLVFCLNPPYDHGIKNVRMHHTQYENGIIPVCSSFMIGDHRFLLTDKEFNLDKIVCGELKTGEIYKKPEPYKPNPTDPNDC